MVNKWPCKLISSHSIWERSVSSKQCLIGIQSRMGVNLIGLRGLSWSSDIFWSSRYVLLGPPGVGVVLLDLVVVRDVGQLLHVRT